MNLCSGPDEVDALYHYAKWNFECGNYSAAAEYLYHYRTLSTNPERNVGAMWGKVAADILLQVSCLFGAPSSFAFQPGAGKDLAIRLSRDADNRVMLHVVACKVYHRSEGCAKILGG